MIRTLKLRPKFQWTDNINAGKNNTDGKNDKITTEAEEQEELRDVITSDALEDLEVIQGKGEWKNKMTNRKKNANTSTTMPLLDFTTLKLFLNQDIYVDDDDLNESNPNMMLIRRNSEADDDDNLGEMIGFPRVPLLPDHGKLSSYLPTPPW